MSAPTWTDVARKDFEDAVRSKMLWSLIGVFVVFSGFLLAVVTAAFDVGDAGAQDGLAFIAQFGQLFIPLIALIASYMAVVGERRTGSLRVLLAYPFSRRDVVFGKLAGRSAVIVVTLLAGFTAATLIAAALFGELPLAAFVKLLAVALLFGLAFTGVAVGISAGTSSRGKAMALAIGLFLLMFMFWDGAVAGVYFALHGSLPGLEVDAWYFLAKRLNPMEAYRVLADAVLEPTVGSMVRLPLEDVPADATAKQLKLVNRVGGSLPFYLKDWFAGVILAAWAVVPVAFGYRQFEQSDLG